MLRIAVRTNDDRLYQKLLLMLEERAVIVRTYGDRISGFDLVIYDARGGQSDETEAGADTGSRIESGGSVSGSNIKGGVVSDTASYIGIGEGERLSYPFTERELLSAISDGGIENITRLRSLPEERAVIIDGETVTLTDVEWRLYEMIAKGGGDYVSREELILGVWGGSCTESSLNVYIHYLREKLERSGERVILSSRRGGYKIDEKFL